MPSPSPLALCVAIACAGIPGLGVAQTPPPTSAPPTAEDVWRLRDGRQWYAALSTLERAAAHAPDDPGLYKLRALLLADIGSGYRAWTLYQARPELFDADEREWLEARRLGRMVTWSEAQGASDETRLDDARAAEAAIETYQPVEIRPGEAPDSVGSADFSLLKRSASASRALKQARFRASRRTFPAGAAITRPPRRSASAGGRGCSPPSPAETAPRPS